MKGLFKYKCYEIDYAELSEKVTGKVPASKKYTF